MARAGGVEIQKPANLVDVKRLIGQRGEDRVQPLAGAAGLAFGRLLPGGAVCRRPPVDQADRPIELCLRGVRAGMGARRRPVQRGLAARAGHSSSICSSQSYPRSIRA
jgi:hypothetical protein